MKILSFDIFCFKLPFGDVTKTKESAGLGVQVEWVHVFNLGVWYTPVYLYQIMNALNQIKLGLYGFNIWHKPYAF